MSRRSNILWLKRLSLVMSMLVILLVVYFSFRAQSAPDENFVQQTILESDITSATSEIEYVQTVDGIPRFKIKASRNVATSGGMNHLEDVNVVYYGPSGERTDSIKADECLYSATEQQIRFKNNININLANGFSIDTSELVYDKNSENASSPGRFTLNSMQGHGSGVGFELNMQSRDLHVHHDLQFNFQAAAGDGMGAAFNNGPLLVQASSGWVEGNRQILHLRGGVNLSGTFTSLKCQEVDLVFTEQRVLAHMQCDGNARYILKQDETDIILTGGKIRFEPSTVHAGLSRITAQEDARLSLNGSLLQADEITILPRDRSGIESINAQENVQFVSEAQGRIVRGNILTMSFTGENLLRRVLVEGTASLSETTIDQEVQWSADEFEFLFAEGPSSQPRLETVSGLGSSNLQLINPGHRQVWGRADRIQIVYNGEGTFPSRAAASGACQWRISQLSSRQEFRLNCAEFWVDFFQNSHFIKRFNAAGGVRLHREEASGKWIETESETADGHFAKPNARETLKVFLKKSVRLRTDSVSASGSQADYFGDKLTIKGQPEVQTADTRTEAQEFIYNSSDGTIYGRGPVKSRITPNEKTGNSAVFPLSGVGRTSGQITILANEVTMNNVTDSVRYQGACRMLQGNNLLQARQFDWSRADGIFSAAEDVRLHYRHIDQNGKEVPLSISSVSMKYNPAQQNFEFNRNIIARTDQGVLHADRLLGFITDEQGLQRLLATGNILIKQTTREASGTEALYNLEQKIMILNGDPAQVKDLSDGRTTQGVCLTLSGENDRIHIANEKKELK